MTPHLTPDQKPSDRSIYSLRGELEIFYADQAHLIDSASHRAWAETFVPEGEFHSPTYPQPAIGRDALAGISRAFADAAAKAGEIQRHVITNLSVVAANGDTARTRAYLLVTAATPGEVRVLRIVTLHDDLSRLDGAWRVQCRRISTDVQP